VFDQFSQLVSDASGWAYAILFLFAFLDALVPVVPSETAAITAGVVAAAGDLSLPLVVAAAATGAFLGDNAAYGLGRGFGDRVVARFFSGEKARRRIGWAKDQLAERGGELIVIGRFIPGGRIAVTVSAGLVRYDWRRFVAFDAAAALAWALYACLLGYFGGRAFEAWKGLLLALGLGFGIGGVTEVVRRLRKRRSARAG
jgi:membrane protein DedA with SNARE-associated domain